MHEGTTSLVGIATIRITTTYRALLEAALRNAEALIGFLRGRGGPAAPQETGDHRRLLPLAHRHTAYVMWRWIWHRNACNYGASVPADRVSRQANEQTNARFAQIAESYV